MTPRFLSILSVVLVFVSTAVAPALAETVKPCEPVETKPVKIEGFISKKFKKQRKTVFKEFGAMGHTRVALRVFPMGETSGVVAIGRCVPAYIARHVLSSTLKYATGVSYLVNQAFLSPQWIGIGTTMFDEPSQQSVTPQQVEELLDPSLTTDQFHALYRKFSIQSDKVPYFGMQVDNAKKVDK